MVKINIGTSFDPKEVIVSEDKTLRKLFSEVNVSITNQTTVTMNGARLGDLDLDKTLKQLNVQEGALITANEKLVGA